MEPAPPNDLPIGARTWSVRVENGQSLTYGDIHEIMHRDISTGNDYRKERIKHLTTLATGVFALTVTFHKDLFGGHISNVSLIIVLAGWAFLLLSLLVGILHFRAWEDFYLAHRGTSSAVWARKLAELETDPSKKGDAIAAATAQFTAAGAKIRSLQKWFRVWDRIQSGCLLLGMALIALYVATSPVATGSQPAPPSVLVPTPPPPLPPRP